MIVVADVDEVPEGERPMTMRGPGGRIGMAPHPEQGVTSKDAINVEKKAKARGLRAPDEGEPDAS